MKKIKVLTLKEFAAMEMPSKQYIVDPFLPERGLVEIFSKTGVGKTTFALNLGIAVALGKPFLKWGVPEAQKVLYIDGEMSPPDMKERAIAASQYFGVDVSEIENFNILNRDVNNGLLPDIGELSGQREFDLAIQDAKLIILDNLSTLRFTGKENEADSWSIMQRWLLEMRGKGKTVVILHHAGKDGTSRGSSRRHDALNTVIRLERPLSYQQSEGAKFELYFDKARDFYGDAAEPVGLAHTIIDGISIWDMFTITNEREEEVVKLTNEGMKQIEIAEKLNINQSTVSKLLASARAKGLL